MVEYGRLSDSELVRASSDDPAAFEELLARRRGSSARLDSTERPGRIYRAAPTFRARRGLSDPEESTDQIAPIEKAGIMSESASDSAREGALEELFEMHMLDRDEFEAELARPEEPEARDDKRRRAHGSKQSDD
jgi:hypothetical protein